MNEYGSPGGSAGPAGHAPLLRGRKGGAVGASRSGGRGGDRDPHGDSPVLQQTAGNTATAALLQPRGSGRGDLVRSVIDGPGRPLEPEVAETVARATGGDTSAIRVHDGPQAARAARAVDAEMFASGNHIVAPEGLDVSTEEGMFKAVHEVHHIVNQQARGPVEGTDTHDGLRISDPSDRHEQEANAVALKAVVTGAGNQQS